MSISLVLKVIFRCLEFEMKEPSISSSGGGSKTLKKLRKNDFDRVRERK